MKVFINRASIQEKVNIAISKPEFKAKALGGMDDAEALRVVKDLGNELADFIQTAADESLASTELATIGGITAESARKISDGLYEIDISIDKQSRPSLAPKKYDGVDDMAALFNNGWSGGGSYGVWHGERIRGKRFHTPTRFVQDGVQRFWATEGSPYYRILSIDISSRFT